MPTASERGSASVKAACFDLTRAWLHCPERLLCREAVQKADSALGRNISRDFPQVVGYLLLDARRGQPSGQVAALPNLGFTDEERELLRRLHADLSRLATGCARAFGGSSMVTEIVTGPYRQYAESLPADTQSQRIFPKNLVANLEAACARSELARAIADLHNIVSAGRVSEATLREQVTRMEKDIHRSELGEAPEYLPHWCFLRPKNRPDRAAVGLIAVATAVRSAVALMTAMVFQALREDKLRTVGSHNTFWFEGSTMNLVGSSVALHVQATRGLVGSEIDAGEIVYVKLPELPTPIDGIWRVDGTQFSWGAAGSRCRLELRQIDENMSPFSQLGVGWL